ncbi:MAG: hypothetical protein K6E30_00640 [Lachnospiraceae bacterium]|nr:hypothetical protein [Lachnospiraceae bacterium]
MKVFSLLFKIILFAGLLGALVFYQISSEAAPRVYNEASYNYINQNPLPSAAESSGETSAESSGELSEDTSAEPSESEGGEESAAEPAVPVEFPHGDYTPERIIFLGDARCLAMYEAAKNEDVDIRFVSTEGADLNWLNRSAFESEYGYVTRQTAIVVMLGISDMDRAQEYCDVLNSWGKVFTNEHDFGAHFYFNSVNPVDPGLFNNEQVEAFNETVKNGLNDSVIYLDTYNVLLQSGYETTDTLHYTDETTAKLYEILKTYFNWM